MHQTKLCDRLYAEDCQNGIHDTHQASPATSPMRSEVEFLHRGWIAALPDEPSNHSVEHDQRVIRGDDKGDAHCEAAGHPVLMLSTFRSSGMAIPTALAIKMAMPACGGSASRPFASSSAIAFHAIAAGAGNLSPPSS